MNKNQMKAEQEMNLLLKKARDYFKIDSTQTQEKIYFDTLIAIEKASQVLNQAWELGTKHHLTDNSIRLEFVKMFSYFGKIKRQLREHEQKH